MKKITIVFAFMAAITIAWANMNSAETRPELEATLRSSINNLVFENQNDPKDMLFVNNEGELVNEFFDKDLDMNASLVFSDCYSLSHNKNEYKYAVGEYTLTITVGANNEIASVVAVSQSGTTVYTAQK